MRRIPVYRRGKHLSFAAPNGGPVVLEIGTDQPVRFDDSGNTLYLEEQRNITEGLTAVQAAAAAKAHFFGLHLAKAPRKEATT